VLGLQIPVGTVGALDFDQTKAPGFAALVTRLTDDRNDNLIFSYFWGTANDRAGEASAFGGLLTGRKVDFMRLVIEEFNVATTDTGFAFSLRSEWQVWGQGRPVLSVPEPATYALMLVGLSVVGFANRRRKST
jgi:hypothetical protein